MKNYVISFFIFLFSHFLFSQATIDIMPASTSQIVGNGGFFGFWGLKIIGDINEDGFDDVAIGAPISAFCQTNQANNTQGAVYVFFGSPTGIASRTLTDFQSVASNADLVFVNRDCANTNFSQTGISIEKIGNIYDPFPSVGKGDEFAIGASHANANTGGVFILKSRSTAAWNLLPCALPPPPPSTPPTYGGMNTLSDPKVKDLNAIADVKYVTVVANSTVLGLGCTNSPNGERALGAAMASGKDVNGDGTNDIIIGNPVASDAVGAGNHKGRVYLISGVDIPFASSFPATARYIEDAATNPEVVASFIGNSNLDFLGRSLSLVEVDADGKAEILIGNNADPLGFVTNCDPNAAAFYGHAALVYGQSFYVPSNRSSFQNKDIIDVNGFMAVGVAGFAGQKGVVFTGEQNYNDNNNPLLPNPATPKSPQPGGDYFGNCVVACGDLNDDGFQDFAISAKSFYSYAFIANGSIPNIHMDDAGSYAYYSSSKYAGKVYIFYGSADFKTVNHPVDYNLRTTLLPKGNISFIGRDVHTGLGWQMSNVGDIGSFCDKNALDGKSDFVITAGDDRWSTGYQTTDNVYIVYGQTTSFWNNLQTIHTFPYPLSDYEVRISPGVGAGYSPYSLGGFFRWIQGEPTLGTNLAPGNIYSNAVYASGNGDINGDGKKDLLIADNLFQSGGTNLGKLYMIHGGSIAPAVPASYVFSGGCFVNNPGNTITLSGVTIQNNNAHYGSHTVSVYCGNTWLYTYNPNSTPPFPPLPFGTTTLPTVTFSGNCSGPLTLHIGGTLPCMDGIICQKPTIAISGTPNNSWTVCANTSVTLTAVSSCPMNQYLWFKNGIAVNSSPSSPIYTITSGAVASTNVYTVQVVYAGSSALSCPSAPISITTSIPTAVITPNGPTTFCANTPTTLNATTGAGYTYQWYRGSIPVATTSSYIPTVSGNHKVVVTDANGCTKTSAWISIIVNPVPTITPAGGAGGIIPVCQTNQLGTQTLTANMPAGSPPATYLWQQYVAGVYYSAGTGATLTTMVNPAQPTKIYRVVATYGNTCVVGSSKKTVQLNSNCRLAGVVAAENEALITIFPNPTAEGITLSTDSDLLKSARIVMLDGLGKKVYEGNTDKDTQEWKIDMQSLSSGMYMIQVIGEKGEISTHKVMKE